jgi:hypothetical protein
MAAKTRSIVAVFVVSVLGIVASHPPAQAARETRAGSLPLRNSVDRQRLPPSRRPMQSSNPVWQRSMMTAVGSIRTCRRRRSRIVEH